MKNPHLVVANLGKIGGHLKAHLLDAGGNEFFSSKAVMVALKKLVAVVPPVPTLRHIADLELLGEIHQTRGSGDRVVKQTQGPLLEIAQLLGSFVENIPHGRPCSPPQRSTAGSTAAIVTVAALAAPLPCPRARGARQEPHRHQHGGGESPDPRHLSRVLFCVRVCGVLVPGEGDDHLVVDGRVRVGVLEGWRPGQRGSRRGVGVLCRRRKKLFDVGCFLPVRWEARCGVEAVLTVNSRCMTKGGSTSSYVQTSSRAFSEWLYRLVSPDKYCGLFFLDQQSQLPRTLDVRFRLSSGGLDFQCERNFASRTTSVPSTVL